MLHFLAKDRAFSLIAAISLHAVVLCGVGKALVHPAEYGVDVANGGIAVDLIAAPLQTEMLPADLEKPEEKAKIPAVPAKPEDFLIPAAVEKSEVKPVEVKKATAVTAPDPSKISGDGSSAVPGDAHTTLQTAGGAWMAQPNYMTNPPPKYPEAARSLGQEGTVLLLVDVGRDGKVEMVRVKKSSGHRLLDNAAYKAVKSWKFQPAKIGSLPVGSKVEVPVRFQLDDPKLQ